MVSAGEIRFQTMNERVALDAMGLAKVCLIDAVDFGKLDVLAFECRGCLLVVRSKSLAVATPMVKLSQYSWKRTMKVYHGA
jgi:hypothetical protein